MTTIALPNEGLAPQAVRIQIRPATDDRDRLTTAFRFVLALPHLILVGGPIALTLSWNSGWPNGLWYDWGFGGGVLGAVAGMSAVVSWFAIVFAGRHPEGLWELAAFFLRWRTRAVAYTALLRDEYPPFGEGPYAVELELGAPPAERDRLTVAFRLVLALPHILAVWALSLAWACTTLVAWFSILFTGRYPESLYDFAVGVLRWNVRVDAYLLLLHDEYPPFRLD
jgi:hypothetical protein